MTKRVPATARVWITDGSLPVFSDTVRLSAKHRVMAGLRTRYEGFVDPAVPYAALEVAGDRPDDVLFVEAEWIVEFPGGVPSEVAPDTPIVLQGLIEGKWLNRLQGTRAWQPASLGNSVIGAGPGIPTTLAALEGNLVGDARIDYESERAGRRTQVTRVSDLRGHNVLELVRGVLETGEELDAIDLGAVGPDAAVVNEKRRMLRAALPLPFPHRAKERLVARALTEGLGMKAGSAAVLKVFDARGAVVGEAALTLED